ncbi:MAG: lytic transglycosylase domain-containing protein [Paracoccaceae bacterium]
MARGVILTAIFIAGLGFGSALAEEMRDAPADGSAETEAATAAEDFPDFTFKRIKAPSAAGPKSRILVQIDPAEQAARLAAGMPRPAVPIPHGGVAPGLAPLRPDTGLPSLPAGSYAWYWDKVSPALSDREGRFPVALMALTQGPSGSQVAAPRLQALQDIANSYSRDILSATVDTEVSPALVLAVIAIESAGRVDAVSSAGATGLMQLIPATAERFGVQDANNAAENIRGGVAYLDWLMKQFNHDPVMVLAAYNAGENAVFGNDGVPPYAETRDYVPKVLAAWAVARGLCLTPPELVSDGCVFSVKG